MKRSLQVLLALSALSCAQAQGPYFGLRADVVGPPSLSLVVSLSGFQIGTPVLDNVELRASLLTLLLANFLQVDVLYTQPLSDTLRGYGGVGGDVITFIIGDPVYSAHATAGIESRLGSSIGLFAKVQPLFFLTGAGLGSGLEDFLWKLNAGINFHFQPAVFV